MTSEIRTNSLTSRAGLSTVTLTDSGPMFSGITTFVDNSTFSVGTGGTIHAPATNTLNIGVNNTESLRIDSNSNLKVAGIVTATHFYGNGANLTGISAGTALSGSTNNTVCTVTGANAIQGESNLSFDGTNLKVGNTATLSNYNQTDILLGDHTGHSGMTILSSPSHGGFIMFSDNNGGGTNAYRGQIEYAHSSDYMRFITDSGERLRITSNGNVDINGTPPWSVVGGDYRSLSISGETASSSGWIWLGNGAAATNADFDLTRINICNGANIVAQITGTTDTSATDTGRLDFYTRANGQSSPDLRLRIKSNGNIGINQTSPQRILHIGTSGTAEANIRLQGGSDHSEIRVKDSDNALSFHYNVGGAGSRELFNSNGSTGHFSINCYSYQALTITTNENGTNGPEIQLMHNSASPAANDIVGQLRYSGKDSAGNTELYSKIETKATTVTSGSETGEMNFSTRGGGAYNNIFRLNARGTASAPSYTTDDMNGIILDTYNTGNPYPRYFNFIAKSAGNTDSNIGFWTEAVGGSPTEKLRIPSGVSMITQNGTGMNIHGQNVNHVDDAVLLVDKTGNADWCIQARSTGNDYGMYTRLGSGAAYALAVYASDTSSFRFRVRGDGVIFASNTSIQSISDVRLKENIVDANSQWDDIKALRFRNFNWKSDSGLGDGKTYLGLIAQEVEPISPNLVDLDAQTKEDIENGVPDPEHKSVKYSIVWMKAVKALQEAQARIETLEQENIALRARVTNLEGN